MGAIDKALMFLVFAFLLLALSRICVLSPHMSQVLLALFLTLLVL